MWTVSGSSPVVKGKVSDERRTRRGRSRGIDIAPALPAWPQGTVSGGYVRGLVGGMSQDHWAFVMDGKAEYMGTDADWEVDVVVKAGGIFEFLLGSLVDTIFKHVAEWG